ncbi:hypothetical protein BS17DRAFT_818049 [Gyrodon lividus]|nr:hypothetical protein BS17DRAFT_818049 [Gyrodon lividus]
MAKLSSWLTDANNDTTQELSIHQQPTQATSKKNGVISTPTSNTTQNASKWSAHNASIMINSDSDPDHVGLQAIIQGTKTPAVISNTGPQAIQSMLPQTNFLVATITPTTVQTLVIVSNSSPQVVQSTLLAAIIAPLDVQAPAVMSNSSPQVIQSVPLAAAMASSDMQAPAVVSNSSPRVIQSNPLVAAMATLDVWAPAVLSNPSP